MTAQALSALETANMIRRTRAGWKREVRELPSEHMLVAARRLVSDPPWWALSWRVENWLRCLPYVGQVKVRQLAKLVGFSSVTTLGTLTTRQRDLIWNWLAERYGDTA